MINSDSIKITAFHEHFKPQLLIKNIIAYLTGMKRLPSALKCILSILPFYPTCNSGYFHRPHYDTNLGHTSLWYKLRSHFNWCSPYKIYLHFRIRSSYSKETIHNNSYSMNWNSLQRVMLSIACPCPLIEWNQAFLMQCLSSYHIEHSSVPVHVVPIRATCKILIN